MDERPRRVFIIGLMGSGKSTIGRRLSNRIGWPYVDNDELVVRATGRSAPEIVAADGADALHEAELRAFEHGASLPPPVIVGVAGFVVMDAESRFRMRTAGRVVWLRARPETLHTRVGTGRGRRPAATSLEGVTAVVDERSPTFLEAADVVIDVDRLRPRLVAEEIVSRLGLDA
ncbi:MAG TPA: shikimate kinase [Candidatus Angelobacter sp.]|nr:shikimate kinase [Candidatus Angelobacter sp.]